MNRQLVVLGGAAAASVLWLLACSDNPSEPENRPPVLREIIVQPTSVVPGGQAQVTALANDPDNLPLTYRWSATAGTFEDPGVDPAVWTAPDSSGTFWIRLEVSDGTYTASDSTTVMVGRGYIYVQSEIPGTGISFNGSFPIDTTPHLFGPLPRGTYSVAVETNIWRYEPSRTTVELADGDSVTVDFILPDPIPENPSLGRTDVVEIGGIAFLASGTGFLYGARTNTSTGIFNAALNPATGGANGVLLVEGANVNEPIAVSADGGRLYFVNAGDSLMTARILDFQQDGIVDSLWDLQAMKEDRAFGPAVSKWDEVAYSVTPSPDPSAVPLLRTYLDSTFVRLASSTPGRLPSWDPAGTKDDSYITYENDGVIRYSYLPKDEAPSGGIVTDVGFNTAPAWGPWGPRHIAVLRGTSESDLSELWLVLRTSPQSAMLLSGLLDPRFISWSPVQRSLLFTTNPPGLGPTVTLLYNLPVP